MDIEIKKWLYDVLKAITEIESFFDNKNIDLATYQKNIILQRAVERDIAIIGEAINNILKKDESIELSNARKIVDTRNRIIHAYDSISGIVITYLPVLKKEINVILNGNKK
jgi:uncharacterized protein with HEPN domain